MEHGAWSMEHGAWSTDKSGLVRLGHFTSPALVKCHPH